MGKSFSRDYRLHLLLIAGISLLIVYYLIVYFTETAKSSDKHIETFQKNFLKQQEFLAKKAAVVSSALDQDDVNYWPALERSVDKEEINLQIYRNDSLYFWNNQRVSNDILLIPLTTTDTVLLQKAGWYLIHHVATPTYRIFLLKEIKTQYSYNNSFLPGAISNDFTSDDYLNLTSELDNADFVIKNRENKDCIGINLNQNKTKKEAVYLVLLFVYLLFFICLILIVLDLYRRLNILNINKIILFIFFGLDLVLIRYFEYLLRFPTFLKKSYLFQDNYGSIAGLTTPGDIIINTLIILLIAIELNVVLNQLRNENKQFKNKIYLALATIAFYVFVLILFWLEYSSIKALSYESFFGINLFSSTGIIIIISVIGINIGIYFVIVAFNSFRKQTSISYEAVILLILILSGAVYVLLPTLLNIIMVVAVLFILAMAVSLIISDNQQVITLKNLLLVIIIAATSSFLINSAEMNKKDDHQSLTANKLTVQQDTLLEESYQQVLKDIKNDSILIILLNAYEDPEIFMGQYLEEKYFKNIRDKYQIQVFICQEGDSLSVQPEGYVTDCETFFYNKITDRGKPISESLYLIESEPESIYYLGELILNDTALIADHYNVFVEFYFSFIPDGLGYPELLVDNSIIDIDLSGYSFAFYEDNMLTYKFGNFDYYTDYSFIEAYETKQLFNLSGWRHFKVQVEEGYYLVVSRPRERISERIFTFSSLFICLVFIAFIVLLTVFFNRTKTYFSLSFRNRLQLIFISTISLIIAILAIITLYYIQANNEKNLNDQLNEKTYSVLIELQHKLGGASTLDEYDPIFLQQLLNKFSEVFFSDINLYNPTGQLVASSRMEIFEKGLLSENINPMAYEELFVKNKLYYITLENIGTVSYYSSYVPLILNGDQYAGIINLPYFARLTEVNRSYNLLLFTFINMFVILGISGVFLALLLSRILTKPLLMLQKSFVNVRIDQENEKIEWERDDEIGQLINEYNKMVDKLEQSAELLKHSERESAWREVAQQIAHEIKNPLTPMKLNVQYLEKAFREGDPELEEKFNNISGSLISQIDSLNKVAEMFSDFAKTNQGKFEPVNLNNIIQAAVSLYESHSRVAFSVVFEDDNYNYVTLALEKDLLRVFNNLIKNAIQSLEGIQDAGIEIKTELFDDQIQVTVSDNGKGISKEIQASIFKPYFTTKTGGTGLGLAIVRNIITEIGGEINFETGQGRGTVFFLRFKRY